MNVYVIPVVALMIPLVIVPVALWFRHARAIREMEHAERMRALEVGADVRPIAGMNWPSAAVCVALGAGVPVGTFLMAAWAVVMGGEDGSVFGIALVVSFGALWSAKALADRMIRAALAATEAASPTPAAKPTHFDPDAFDVVGSRG